MIHIRSGTSAVYTLVQYGMLLYFFAEYGILGSSPVSRIVQAAGGIFAIRAIMEMRKSRLNIAPDPAPGSTLVTSGPYRFIRHPMYTSLILFIAPLLLEVPSETNLLLLLVFISNMILKLLYEERLLRAQFERYGEYMKRSYRLIPWLW
ncbi:MAG: isoprenylcysteine carboxylmethyltransferase family protein [Bacteroidales bacterium]